MKHNLKNELILSLLAMTVLVFSQPAAADELRRTILKVDNLTCTSCLVQIKAELSQNAGVAGMSGDVRQGVVIVDHEQTLASEEVAAMVSKTGYAATVLGSGTIDRANTIKETARSSGSCGGGGGGGCGGGGGQASVWAGKEGRGEVVATVFRVENLSCVSCLSRIEEELRKLEGTVGMSGDLRRGLVSVDHAAALGGDKIAAAITALGYPAQMLSSDPAKPGAPASAQATDGTAGSQAGFSGSGSCCNASASLQQLYNRLVGQKKTE